MAEALPAPIQLPQGTVGLLILQGTSPIGLIPSTTATSLVTVAPITTTMSFNNNNNNIISFNNNNYKEVNYQKPIKPAPANGKKKGGSPPLKPPKKFRDEDTEIHRCKRRLDFARLGLHGISKANPVTVARRNERERKRVKQINSTFATLRDHLPETYYQNKNPNKLSKVDTLRGAIEYINSLQDVLDDYQTVGAAFPSICSPDGDAPSPHEQSLKQEDCQFQMELSNALRSVNELLTVQATESLQSGSVNSPTGSTCSSVCSTTSCTDTPGTIPAAVSPEFMDLSYAAAPSYHPMAVQDTTSSLPVTLNEDDLLEFASWF